MIEELLKLKTAPLALVLEKVMDDAAKLTESQLSYFTVVNDKENKLTIISWSKSAMASCRMVTKPLVYPLDETGLWGDALREKKAVVTNDYANLSKPTKKGYPPGHVAIKNHMNLPVIEKGKVKAVVGVGNRDSDYGQKQINDLTEYSEVAWKILKEKIPEHIVQD
jgi:hypothetical protein